MLRRNPKVKEAWDFYQDSLEANDREILNALASGARAEVRTVDLASFDAPLSILRRHCRAKKADRLVNLFVERDENVARVIRRGVVDLSSLLHDEELRNAIAAAASNLRDARDPLEVVRHVAQSGNFNDDDV